MHSEIEALLEAWRTGARPAPDQAGDRRCALVKFGDGTAEVSLAAATRHHNPFGTVQGGIVCTVADVAMGAAVATRLEAGEGFATHTMSSVFIRPFSTGDVRARAKVVHRGRSTAHVECEILGDGELIAKVSSTCLIKASAWRA